MRSDKISAMAENVQDNGADTNKEADLAVPEEDFDDGYDDSEEEDDEK